MSCDSNFKLIKAEEKIFLINYLKGSSISDSIVSIIKKDELNEDDGITILKHLQALRRDNNSYEINEFIQFLHTRIALYRVAIDVDIHCCDFVNILSSKNLGLNSNFENNISILKIILTVLNCSEELYNSLLVKKILVKHRELILKALSVSDDDFTVDLKEWFDNYLNLSIKQTESK